MEVEKLIVKDRDKTTKLQVDIENKISLCKRSKLVKLQMGWR